jgi:hypothetical protein
MISPFASALAPVAARLRQREATVRPISQVIVQLAAGEATFTAARNAVLRWMDNRAGRKLPKIAWDGETFELEDVGAQRTAAVSITKPHYWAARLDDADRNVPQRVWTTEIGIGQQEGGAVLFGCRLLCVTRGEDVVFDRSVPGFVRQIVENQEAKLDGYPIAFKPGVAQSEADVDDLVSLLFDARRQSVVIVFALPDNETDISKTAVSAEEVAAKTIGTAHVVILTGPASFSLSDRVGKEFSVFRQAIRTYKPSFNPDQDEPFRHPLALPRRIATWPDGGGAGYQKFLIDRILAASVSTRDFEQRLPPFVAVRRTAAELRISTAREAGSSDAELLKLAEEEIGKLRKALDEERETHAGLWNVAEEERDQALAEAQQAREANRHLRFRIEQQEQQIKAKGGKAVVAPIPNSLTNFADWCAANLSGSVEIHNRAFQGVNKSEYEDVSLIYKSLLVLRDHYVPMRREGGLERKRAYGKACHDLGLEEVPTFAGPRAGEEGDTYFVRYAGRRIELDRHLKKGNSREPRWCFRLYFFWDNDEQQVVVGWMPSHLDTRIT